jgi:hypothetical protein
LNNPSSAKFSSANIVKQPLKKKEKKELKKFMRPVQKLLKSLETDTWGDKKPRIDDARFNFFTNVSPINQRMLDEKYSKTPTGIQIKEKFIPGKSNP